MNLLRAYLQLPVIVGPLPYNIQNGDVEDAIPVMGNFLWLMNQINANVPALIPTANQSVTFITAASVGGAANAITLTPTPALSGYAAGIGYRFPAKFSNTSSVTINVSGLGPKALITSAGDPMHGEELMIGGIYDICYDGTSFQLLNESQGTNQRTFTPVLTFGGAATGITYSSQVGSYLKIQDIIFFTIELQFTNKGSATGACVISGLPYAANATFKFGSTDSSFSQFISFSGDVSAVVQPSTTTMIVYDCESGIAAVALTDANFANNSYLVVTGYYSA